MGKAKATAGERFVLNLLFRLHKKRYTLAQMGSEECHRHARACAKAFDAAVARAVKARDAKWFTAVVEAIGGQTALDLSKAVGTPKPAPGKATTRTVADTSRFLSKVKPVTLPPKWGKVRARTNIEGAK